MTMDELARRLERAEKRIATLEETLETIKQMHVSKQMQEYIESRQRTLQLTGLLNTISGQGKVDTSEAERQIAQAQAKKNSADQRIREAIATVSMVDIQSATPAELFTYERCRLELYSGLRITGYNGFDEKVIAVPERISGIPVISIGEKAFLNGTMKEVVLPPQIVEISDSAFEACSKLQKINIPNNVITIGKYAFADCKLLSTVLLPNGLKTIGYWAFAASGIERICFPGTLAKIPMRCCMDCNKLNSVSIEEGIEAIEEYAFYGGLWSKNHLTKIVIPKSVKTIGNDAFGNRKETLIACLGMETVSSRHSPFDYNATIYVIPGSAMQKYARDHNIKIKPLTEFPVE